MPTDYVEVLAAYRVSNLDRSIARRRSIAISFSFATSLSLWSS